MLIVTYDFPLFIFLVLLYNLVLPLLLLQLWLSHLFRYLFSLTLTSCPSSYHPLCHPWGFCSFSFSPVSLLTCPFFLLHRSHSTTRRKREPSAGKSLFSTIISWRRRSPLINSERTMWVLKAVPSILYKLPITPLVSSGNIPEARLFGQYLNFFVWSLAQIVFCLQAQ